MKKTTVSDTNQRTDITSTTYQAMNTFDLHATQYVNIVKNPVKNSLNRLYSY